MHENCHRERWQIPSKSTGLQILQYKPQEKLQRAYSELVRFVLVYYHVAWDTKSRWAKTSFCSKDIGTQQRVLPRFMAATRGGRGRGSQVSRGRAAQTTQVVQKPVRHSGKGWAGLWVKRPSGPELIWKRGRIMSVISSERWQGNLQWWDVANPLWRCRGFIQQWFSLDVLFRVLFKGREFLRLFKRLCSAPSDVGF